MSNSLHDVRAGSFDSALAGRLCLLVGGALNGFAVRMLEAYYQYGASAISLGVSPFELIVLFVGVVLILQSGRAGDGSGVGLGWAEVLTALMLLVPSSTVSWAAVAAYSAYRLSFSTGSERLGLLLFLGLALSSLWSAVLMRWIGPIVTTMEAAVVGSMLAIFKQGVIQSGNVVGVPSEHSLVVMSACSSADGVGKALLGFAAVACFAGCNFSRRLAIAAGLIAVLYVATNFLRLIAMSWSWELYQFAHGPVGANLFDGFVVLAIFGMVFACEEQ